MAVQDIADSIEASFSSTLLLRSLEFSDPYRTEMATQAIMQCGQKASMELLDHFC
jgi:hypothetical protein